MNKIHIKFYLFSNDFQNISIFLAIPRNQQLSRLHFKCYLQSAAVMSKWLYIHQLTNIQKQFSIRFKLTFH